MRVLGECARVKAFANGDGRSWKEVVNEASFHLTGSEEYDRSEVLCLFQLLHLLT